MRLSVKTQLFIAVAFTWGLGFASSDVVPVNPNSFLEHNPDYRERAGASYEASYLPAAAEGLVAALTPQIMPEEEAKAILRTFIYDSLDRYIADEGEVSRRAHDGVVRKLDAVVESKTLDPVLLKRYAAWKSGHSVEYPNPLSFLTDLSFQSPPVRLILSDDMARGGISVSSLTSLDDTASYTSVVGVEPYQVFVVSGAASKSVDALHMTLLFFRKVEAHKVLAALNNGKTNVPNRPELFWQTCRHLVVALGSEPVSGEKAQLSRWIRRQWTEDGRC